MRLDRVGRVLPGRAAVAAILLFAALRPDADSLQAGDGGPEGRVTWSGTIRIQRERHKQESGLNNRRDETVTGSIDVVATTVYEVTGLPQENERTWGSADVPVELRQSEDVRFTHQDVDGDYVRNSQTSKSGAGRTTGGVQLTLRDPGEAGPGHCVLSMWDVGQRDDGGAVTRPVLINRTDHHWGVEQGRKYDKTETGQEQVRPDGANLEIPCAKDARSLHGTRETEKDEDGSTKISWDLSQDGEARTEVELIPPEGYELWQPEAGEDESTIGNEIDVGIVAHAKGDPDAKPPRKVLRYKITLADTSRERGVDSNWPPRSRSKDDLDMRIDPDNGWIRLTDETGQSAETREAGLTDFRVTVNSYDWGGSTKLQVVAELEGGQSVVAHVRGHADQHALSLPRDENQNHIADWWEHWFELADVGESADDDDTPAGDGDHGDSIALYDEYRGFHVHAAHERLSPEIKDLFIWDRDGIGFGLYAQATGVQTHLIWSVERSAKAGGANDNLVTPNGRRGDVFAVLLVNAPIEDGVVGEAEGGPGVPRNISKVTVDARLARLAYGMAAEMGLASTIGHELGHATNIWHHGADPPDYSVDEGRCGEAHGRTRTWTCPAGDCLEVAGKGGKYSGDDQCLMRYDMARFYENDAGVCWWRHGGVTVKGSVYGKDVPGTTLCESARGTGVNDPANKDNKAGDATKGDCAHQLCLKNESH